ncbi:MAG: gamma carbonic anhydrase family protein [Clostridium sp.]|uniref:gamma carbonic anhydrase family protein n=1 Tax=Clostridium sp. TaxID=1506 RepID=UPI00304993FA
MIKTVKGKTPKIDDSCFIAENATVVGDVTIGAGSNIWYSAAIRSDMDTTIIGKNTNIQENSTVHDDFGISTTIGDNVTIGHNCIIHGCTVGNNVLVGMGSIVLNGAEIGENTIIGAGSLVTQNKKIPSGVLCIGSPAKVVRELTTEEIESIRTSAIHYVELAQEHK